MAGDPEDIPPEVRALAERLAAELLAAGVPLEPWRAGAVEVLELPPYDGD